MKIALVGALCIFAIISLFFLVNCSIEIISSIEYAVSEEWNSFIKNVIFNRN